nr:vicilin-like seed storage protein At2g28490 [Ipomoea batatas]
MVDESLFFITQGNLDKSSPNAGYVLLMFYDLYDGRSREEFETDLIGRFGSLVKIPLLKSERSSFTGLCEVYFGGRNEVVTISILVGIGGSIFEFAVKQVLEQLRAIATGETPAIEKGRKKTWKQLCLLPSACLVTENQSLLDNLGKKDSEAGAFLKDKNLESRLQKAHVTLAHKGSHSVAALATKEVVRTESGEIKVVRGTSGSSGRLLHIGFITMEPQSLLIPQYLDSHLVLYINQGEARIGHVYKDELAERKVKSGDIYTIEAGSAFYVENTAEGQRLHIICSIIHTSDSDFRGADTFQGSMMAPHVNPRAIEYGIVLEGTGEVEVVYPNGTLAMNAQVRQGDMFWVPRFFPFCQIASRNGPFVFFGFTTSAKDNQPQFLVGEGSVMQLLKGPELAAALGLSEERVEEIVEAQRGRAILPSVYAAPPESM